MINDVLGYSDRFRLAYDEHARCSIFRSDKIIGLNRFKILVSFLSNILIVDSLTGK